MKHIIIEETDQTFAKRPTYTIKNKRSGAELGSIGWYPPWRQFAANFSDNSIWSHDCLDDVSGFLKELNRKH